MKKVAIISFIFTLMMGSPNQIICVAQIPDSIASLLQNQSNDAHKIDILLRLSSENLHSNPKLSLQYCNLLLTISDSLGIITGTIDGLVQKSKVFYILGKMDSAKALCRNAIYLSDSLGETKRLAKAIYHEGVLLYSTDGPKPANERFRVSYDYYLMIADSSGLSNALNGIGATFYELSQYDSAVNYYLQAIQLGEIRMDTSILGKANLNLGLVYDELKEFQKAKSCFYESMKFNEKVNNMINVAKSMNNLGNIYVQEKDFDSAWQIFNKELELSFQIDHPEGIANAYNGLGDVSDNLGNYEKAHELFTKAKYYYSLIDHRQGMLISYKNLGMNEWRRGNYLQALRVYDSSLLIAQELGYIRREIEVYYGIRDTYVSQRDYESAYNTLLILNSLNDSIINLVKQEKIADLEIRYEKEKDKAQILSLVNKNLGSEVELEQKTRQRNTYLFSGASIVVLFVFFFTYYSQRTRKNRIISEQRINQLEEEKKLLAARSIVVGQEEERKRIARELHDGLGVLLSSAKMHFTTIRDKSPESIPLIDKAAQLLEQATGDVRRISHNMMPGLLTKFGLYEAVEDLFEQVDEMEGIHAEVIIEGEQARLKENTEIMLYRILQEMVNNTLKHAGAANIILTINILADRLKVEYSDDGKGFDLEEKIAQKSMGLTGLQSRVKFLSGELVTKTAPGKGLLFIFEVPVAI